MDKKKILAEIDIELNQVRPHLAIDGGDLELVDITADNKVLIKWLGNCQACNISAFTMKSAEETIKAKFPFISGLEAINGITVTPS